MVLPEPLLLSCDGDMQVFCAPVDENQKRDRDAARTGRLKK